ncbi:MAG TPA: precorrin-4 C(11)-methyltransferase [Candidatus Baltobacteraceae bacterium]|nr:precorrin-4 C(11)-methyltransferase [Candidatus Baltobacteraceae bacterium]
MIVHFIGAGPGAPDLLTLRGRDLIACSPVCLYAGSLVPQEILTYAPPYARVIDTAQLTLDEIIKEIAGAHDRNEDVARLHSGDLSIWSAMAEQIRRLNQLGIPYDVTPGVPAFAAAAATLRQELTLPGIAQTLILTRTSTRSTAMPIGEDLLSLGRTGASLAIHLSIANITTVVEQLTPLYGAEAPVAVVFRATWPDEVTLRGTLTDIAAKVAHAGIDRNALIFIGPSFGQTEFCESHLYSSERERVR